MPAPDYQTCFATCPRHLESLLADELRSIGGIEIKEVSSGVQFTGTLETAYRACLWSRIANRVLLPLGAGIAQSPEQLYTFIQSIDWSAHLGAEQTLAVDFFCANSNITHSQYGALKVKDAVVDQFRETFGQRPSVDRVSPDVRINVYLFRNRARVAIDLSGASLHRRGYRLDGSRAPLKENLAAALLLAAGWKAMAKKGLSFCDPMCGSGTLLIEAAMIAADIAPGLLRDYYGFTGWRQHQPELWNRLLKEAQDTAEQGRKAMPMIFGSDRSAQAIAVARDNIAQAQLSGLVSLVCAELVDIELPSAVKPGLVLLNPPYGIRVEEQARLGQLYADIGVGIKRYFGGWQVSIFSGAPKLLHRTRLPLEFALQVDNGGIPCKLVSGAVPTAADEPGVRHAPDHHAQSEAASVWENAAAKKSLHGPGVSVKSSDNMFANRLKKNLTKLRAWVKQQGISAYRVYDADMPEYAVAVDIYDTDERHVVVQEYQAPSRVDEGAAARRLALVLETIPGILNCTESSVHLKVRKRQKGSDQYNRSSVLRKEHVVDEYDCKLLVNFDDYLDTGLFLDHRKVRHYIQSNASGLRFLNLFAYTAAPTVHAVKGGARSSLTVDMSKTYLEWAERNLTLNGGDSDEHRLLRADCTEWLADSTVDSGELFDLILLDPPTFSNSTRMETDWDVQRDHAPMIRQVMKKLAPAGRLIFSTNFRRFRLNQAGLSEFHLEDRSAWSLDRDFQRNARIHQCWFIRHQ